MKRTTLLFPFLLSLLHTIAQDNTHNIIIADSITAEGKYLYRSEMASWYGTDIFMEGFKDHERIGGYISYPDGDSTRCIFYTSDKEPVVLGTISFDSTYNIKTATANYTERSFTTNEKSLYTIRTKALDIVNQHDTMFKFYKNTNYNLIPVIYKGQRKVYSLTGPSQGGVIIFGNDYLFLFDEQDRLLSKRSLHRNIIITEINEKEEGGQKIVGGMHTHLPETGEYMTVTDVCTLMLYGKFTNWKQYMVVSANHMNIWDCITNRLIIIPNPSKGKSNNKKKDD